jgi:hypothetical protein
MAKLDKYEKELFALGGMDVERPALLDMWIEAEKDKGCDHCWLSSRGPAHPDCDQKIRRWFACREALSAWIFHMYVLRYHFEE